MAASAPPQPPVTPPVDAVPTADKKGPIPYDRHEAVLKNARIKTEQDVTQKFQQQYGPHVELGKRIQADPVTTVVGLVNELAQHPDLGSQVISALARTLGARRGQTQTPESDEPPPDFVGPDGTPFMSAPQQAKWAEWNRQKMLSEVDQRLAPLREREQRQQATERLQMATQDAHDRMAKVVAPFKAMPEYEANRPAIAEKTHAFLAEGYDAQTALGLAVATVLREVVLPHRTAQSQATLQAEAVRKATGSTTVPGAAPAAPSERPTSMLDSFRQIQW